MDAVLDRETEPDAVRGLVYEKQGTWKISSCQRDITQVHL